MSCDKSHNLIAQTFIKGSIYIENEHLLSVANSDHILVQSVQSVVSLIADLVIVIGAAVV